ncbi:hypothetical protein HK335_04165 [Streptococcus agalactiae]|nr:hypothetical protein [Streptococcus agalactiae]MCC9982195.1 hypothetical protein [Streptococcus agalactiae]MCC9986639.1 hypothetical protein [Streptococcus agalactiae]MCC9990993.1 hypothetical protein [Streptococcus agalactiae]MCC9992360.1 hypothetical protein [Streptococcus agalactiae]
MVGGTTAAPGASAVDATSSASTSTGDAPVDQATDATFSRKNCLQLRQKGSAL